MAARGFEEIGEPRELVTAAFGPHSIYTVSEGALRWIGEDAAERELPIHIHLSETEDEVVSCVRDHGVRPAEYLDRLGVLGPRTVLAHGVWLDESELALVEERGATVVTNPVANLKLAVGRVFPYRAARRHGSRSGSGRTARAPTIRSTSSRTSSSWRCSRSTRRATRRFFRPTRHGTSPPAGRRRCWERRAG